MTFQHGLTTAELVVTLFVAALFIISGYQLFNAVSLHAANAREMAEASNIAYKIIRSDGAQYRDDVTVACTSTPHSTTVTLGTTTLSSPTARILRCRPTTGSAMLRVTVEVEYGNNTPKRKVVQATYVSPS